MKEKYSWARKGGYECSSKGDRRFSAFYALLEDGNSIEWHYQTQVKGYATIKEGKGKPPLPGRYTREGLWQAYMVLWRRWASLPGNMYKLRQLQDAIEGDPFNCVLSDMFATTPINQARAIATLLNEFS